MEAPKTPAEAHEGAAEAPKAAAEAHEGAAEAHEGAAEAPKAAANVEPARKIWERNNVVFPTPASPEVNELLKIEAEAKKYSKLTFEAAKEVHGSELVDPLVTLLSAAEADLTAGCELARHGYIKQAYTLWRSWLEEVLLAVYFVEAPLVRLTWRTVERIERSGDRPVIQLMLHQLLVTTGDRAHPFGVAYESRFQRLFDVLRISGLSSKKTPVKIAEHTLTDLSQGVHGTFRPKAITNAADIPDVLAKHANPVLGRTVHVAGLFLFALVQSALSLPEQALIKMAGTGYVLSDEALLEERILTPLLPQLRAGIALLRDKVNG